MQSVKAEALVSTVIPCFDGSPFIARAIASVLAQTHAPVEVIVVDDGSADDSAAIVRALAQRDERIRLLRHERNLGVAHARNTGIAAARGRYLAFLDADDHWAPRKLERQLELMGRSGAGLVYTGVVVQNALGRVLGSRRVPATVTAEKLLVHNVIATSSVLLDTVATGPVRMPPLRMRQDLATWYALLRAGVSAAGLDEPLIVYTKRRGSLSANKLAAARAYWHLYRAHLHRPLHDAASLFVRYAAAAVRRV